MSNAAEILTQAEKKISALEEIIRQENFNELTVESQIKELSILLIELNNINNNEKKAQLNNMIGIISRLETLESKIVKKSSKIKKELEKTQENFNIHKAYGTYEGK